MEKSSSEVVKKSVPIEEGLFTIPSYGGQEGQLIGSKCRLCGEVFFPKRRRRGTLRPRFGSGLRRGVEKTFEPGDQNFRSEYGHQQP